MADDTAPQIDFNEHERTYVNFLRGSVAVILGSLIVLVALVMFAFGSGASATVLGFLGLIFGLAAVVLDLRMGSNWTLSLVVTAIFVFITLMWVA
ncbi:aa3-type cytochrome c oxidase subunit IV [Rhodoligotrophos defluvii]|uniref:aa3-type cytochrome c oxidase subunit IV n=1 Tax=Rhodoligotrophos defluvii TaxID=2561934 RepID=UPI0010C98607|nr:aa3-type cytochrome c oxidase subunit IV [Rhodoligotrophos defluvii]